MGTNDKTKNIATVAGAGLGAWVGAGIGIAGFFGAISGTIPVALLGAYAARKLVSGEFAEAAKQSYEAKEAELAARREEMRRHRASGPALVPPKVERRKKPPESP